MIDESSIKADIVAYWRSTIVALILRHEDQFTSGTPDISVSRKITLWCEVKKDDHEVETLQAVTLRRLRQLGNPAWLLRVRVPKTGYWVVELETNDGPVTFHGRKRKVLGWLTDRVGAALTIESPARAAIDASPSPTTTRACARCIETTRRRSSTG